MIFARGEATSELVSYLVPVKVLAMYSQQLPQQSAVRGNHCCVIFGGLSRQHLVRFERSTCHSMRPVKPAWLIPGAGLALIIFRCQAPAPGRRGWLQSQWIVLGQQVITIYKPAAGAGPRANRHDGQVQVERASAYAVLKASSTRWRTTSCTVQAGSMAGAQPCISAHTDANHSCGTPCQNSRCRRNVGTELQLPWSEHLPTLHRKHHQHDGGQHLHGPGRQHGRRTAMPQCTNRC